MANLDEQTETTKQDYLDQTVEEIRKLEMQHHTCELEILKIRALETTPANTQRLDSFQKQQRDIEKQLTRLRNKKADEQVAANTP